MIYFKKNITSTLHFVYFLLFFLFLLFLFFYFFPLLNCGPGCEFVKVIWNFIGRPPSHVPEVDALLCEGLEHVWMFLSENISQVEAVNKLIDSTLYLTLLDDV